MQAAATKVKGAFICHPRLWRNPTGLLAQGQSLYFLSRATASADEAIKRAIREYGITEPEWQKRLAAYRVV